MPAPILIIAYGNPLRGDDGVAWKAADLLEDKFPESQVEVICLHQLAPEVAEDLRRRDLVIFLDAAYADKVHQGRASEILVREVPGGETRQNRPAHFTHVYSPAQLLHLARELYGVAPRAFLITAVGKDFGHGECLSNAVASALPRFVAAVERLVKHGTQSYNARNTK